MFFCLSVQGHTYCILSELLFLTKSTQVTMTNTVWYMVILCLYLLCVPAPQLQQPLPLAYSPLTTSIFKNTWDQTKRQKESLRQLHMLKTENILTFPARTICPVILKEVLFLFCFFVFRPQKPLIDVHSVCGYSTLGHLLQRVPKPPPHCYHIDSVHRRPSND